jgi:integrase
VKLATWPILFFLATVPAGWTQTLGNDDTTYTVQGATPEHEAVLPRQIQVMNPPVLPYRIRFVPHWQYLHAAKTYQVHIPTGMASKMFTHHLLGGVFTFAIAQGHLPRGTVNPLAFCEIQTVPDFDGRAYSLEEIALMLGVLPEPSRTVVAFAAFTGLRAGEVRGLMWEAYSPGDGNALGIVRVMRSVWRGHIGEPKNSRSKAPVPLIPQLETILERHRQASGNPATGPIFMNGAGKGLDLDSLYRWQMREPLKRAEIEWEGWHGFRRGLATNLERIGVRESIAAMILRHANDRVTEALHQAAHPRSDRGYAAIVRDFFGNRETEFAPQLLPRKSKHRPGDDDS